MALVPGVKRRSLFEEINRLEEDGDDVIFELMEELKEDNLAAVGFRFHSGSTQTAQDRALKTYEGFLSAMKLLSSDMNAAQKEEIVFPADHKKLYFQLRTFLIFAARYAKGRSLKTAHISYRGLVKYRASMTFWVKRSYATRELPMPPAHTLYNQLTEAMRAAAKKYELTVEGDVNRTAIGLAELRQMIDMETTTTPCIELTEGHHLAWVMGRVCSVRPGSLGPSSVAKKGDLSYLTWRDVVITRGDGAGNFRVHLTFRTLKTMSADPEQAQAGAISPLKATVLPPQYQDNLIFSIPHRLLVIALRRKILKNIDTLDELLDGDQLNILIKPENLDDPVILAAGPRGLSVSDKPCTSANLTYYLKRRGERMGYSDPITFYSIRRRSGTDLSRILGVDQARRLMAHDPDSRILEKYYLDLESTTDVSALALAEPSAAGGQSGTLIAESATMAATALPADVVKNIHGAALNAMVRSLIAGDENYPIGGSESDRKNYRRRVSAAAYKALLSAEVQKQRQAITRSELKDRMDAADISQLMESVQQRARDIMAATPSAAIDTVLPAGDVNGGFAEKTVEEEPEEDLDSLFVGSTEPVVRQTDENDDGEADDEDAAADQEIPYGVAVRAFMEIQLSNTMSKHRDLKNNPETCPLCQEDDTISEEQKAKTYNKYDHLHNHMDSELHTPRARFLRVTKRDHELSESIEWNCQYCTALGVESRFKTQAAMMDHIAKSTVDVNGAEHDRLKTEDGWYEAGWAENVSERHKKELNRDRTNRNRYKIARWGVKYSDDKELLKGIPHPTRPGLTFGGPSDYSVPAHLKDLVQYGGFDDGPGEVPERVKDLITFGLPTGESIQDEASAAAIPSELEGLISFSDFDPWDTSI